MPRKHDASYKMLFSQPIALEEFAWGFLGPDFADAFDFGTARPLPTEHVDANLVRQNGDLLWKIRRRAGGPDALILIEFQSKIEDIMMARMLSYVGNAYQNLHQWGLLKPGETPPHIVPVVVYNGSRPWPGVPAVWGLLAPELRPPELTPLRARGEAGLSSWIQVLDMRRFAKREMPNPNLVHALARMERDPFGCIDEAWREVHDRFPGSGGKAVRWPFDLWVAELAESLDIPKEQVNSMIRGGRMGEIISPWRDEIHRDGMAVGIERGMAQGMERGMEQGIERGIAQGIERGMAQGMERGMARGQADFVGRLARRKFGAATAERLLATLETADATRIVEVFDAVSECDSASELLVRIGEA